MRSQEAGGAPSHLRQYYGHLDGVALHHTLLTAGTGRRAPGCHGGRHRRLGRYGQVCRRHSGHLSEDCHGTAEARRAQGRELPLAGSRGWLGDARQGVGVVLARQGLGFGPGGLERKPRPPPLAVAPLDGGLRLGLYLHGPIPEIISDLGWGTVGIKFWI